MLDASLTTEYLDRIGASRPPRPDLAGLRHLQERQLLTVPFENLGYHLGEDVELGDGAVEKIVRGRRGGGCYETNPALAMLLRGLGYTVELLPGRVYRPDRLGPPMCHVVLRVTVDGDPWLVDTGFGRNSRHPLRLLPGLRQSDPHGTYELVPVPGGGYDLLRNGRPQYRVDDRPAELADFQPTLWWYRTSPDSPFLQDVFCTLATPDGRVTLKGDRLQRIAGGRRTVTELGSPAAVLAAYRDCFGIELHRLPGEPLIPVGGTIGVQLD